MTVAVTAVLVLSKSLKVLRRLRIGVGRASSWPKTRLMSASREPSRLPSDVCAVGAVVWLRSCMPHEELEANRLAMVRCYESVRPTSRHRIVSFPANTDNPTVSENAQVDGCPSSPPVLMSNMCTDAIPHYSPLERQCYSAQEREKRLMWVERRPTLLPKVCVCVCVCFPSE